MFEAIITSAAGVVDDPAISEAAFPVQPPRGKGWKPIASTASAVLTGSCCDRARALGPAARLREILMRVRASSLNYRDLMVLKGGGRYRT